MLSLLLCLLDYEGHGPMTARQDDGITGLPWKALYIADSHHRAPSSSKTGLKGCSLLALGSSLPAFAAGNSSLRTSSFPV